MRTDPRDGYGARYRQIQTAKEVFDVGNNTAAITAAAAHAREDERAKTEALHYLADEVDADTLATVAALLSTPQLPLRVDVKIHGSDRGEDATSDVEIRTGTDE